jgi:serine/threonine protein kinase
MAETLTLATCISSAMIYVVSKRYTHRDLASRNCLLGENSNVKLADFGLSRPFDDGKDYYLMRQGAKLPMKWTDPGGVIDKKVQQPLLQERARAHTHTHTHTHTRTHTHTNTPRTRTRTRTQAYPTALNLCLHKHSHRVSALSSFSSHQFGEWTDVWSFGVTLWELFTHAAVPYTEVANQEIQRRLNEGLRLTQPEG